MGTAKEAGSTGKGRIKRLGLFTLLAGAVILGALMSIYPKVDPASLATFSVLLAIVVGAVINYLLERREK